MIAGINSHKLPSLWTIVPWFLLSAFSLLIISVLIFISESAFFDHYFQPKILAITHIATIGFITSIIFGAMYQMLPVVLEVELYSEKIAQFNFIVYLIGLITLSYSFWTFDLGLAGQVASLIVFGAFLLFAINFWISIRAVKVWKIEADLIFTSVFWLLITGFVGVLLVFNFTDPFIPLSHLEMLKIHAHMGFIGWFLLLIEGVGAKFIPMFLLSHVENKNYLKASYLLNNIGLILFVSAVFWQLPEIVISSAVVIITIGVLVFLLYIRKVYLARKRPVLDAPMKISLVAFISLLFVLCIAQVLPLSLISPSKQMLLTTSYGVLILLGVAGTLIVGQSLKILPFIIWIHTYKNEVGKKSTPQPKDLISENLSRIIFASFVSGVLILVVSIFLEIKYGVVLSGFLLTLSSVIYLINLFKAINHKPIKL